MALSSDGTLLAMAIVPAAATTLAGLTVNRGFSAYTHTGASGIYVLTMLEAQDANAIHVEVSPREHLAATGQNWSAAVATSAGVTTITVKTTSGGALTDCLFSIAVRKIPGTYA